MSPRIVGLLNSMPDCAMRRTELQFRDQLGPGVELKLFCLPGIHRQGLALQQMQATHAPFESLAQAGLDGLIVTGMEPRAAHLRHEPFWPALASVIDWTCKDSVPTIWSCLAAHAAVLHLSGIERRRCAHKHSGLYRCTAGAPSPWSDGLPPHWLTAHSRWHDVAETDLRRLGYVVLARAEGIGVDAFAAAGLPFLFFQGHPEYDPRALLREYVRDVLRYLDGSHDRYPPLPLDYLDPDSTRAFLHLQQRALADRATRLQAEFGQAVRDAQMLRQPRASAHTLIGNWAASLRPSARPQQPALRASLAS